MAEPNKYKLYLYDLGPIVKERALEAKADKMKASEDGSNHDYAAGRLMAFNEIVSILQQQADGFGIPLEELRLDGVDPDRDLI